MFLQQNKKDPLSKQIQEHGNKCGKGNQKHQAWAEKSENHCTKTQFLAIYIFSLQNWSKINTQIE